ncbi:MAG: DUF2070 family protein [Candidatus Nanohaloarchaeota archaeon QJJ-9]|nr:DUF2070 family protein [Candidatus Nanohaloarchaeota archaeon QJJ-9]
MPEDLSGYRKVIFRSPSLKKLLILNLLVGILFGSVNGAIAFLIFDQKLLWVPILSLLLYIIPSVINGELLASLSKLSRKWTYSMSFIDQITVFGFSLIIPLPSSHIWSLMWLGLATVYLLGILGLVGGRGRRKYFTNFAYPLIYPLWLLAVFHTFVGSNVGVSRMVYIHNSTLFFITSILLGLTLLIFEFVIKANSKSISALDFLSNVILDEEKAIEDYIETHVYNQSLEIEGKEKARFYIPWIHPGPVSGFGGGNLIPELVDESSFFLHVPSAHSMDLADPEEVERFKSPPEAEKSSKASKLLKGDKGGFKFWGRMYGDSKIVFIQNKDVDDYDPSMIYDIKEDHENLTLIDMHNQPMDGEGKPVQPMDPRSKILREGIESLVQKLEEAELKDYRAGFKIQKGYSILVEELGDQKTVQIVMNANGKPPVLKEVEKELEFDENLLLTTDTHQQLSLIANPPPAEKEEIIESVRESEENLESAEAGISEEKLENVNILGGNYGRLIATLNVMGRLVPISLLLYYISLIFIAL